MPYAKINNIAAASIAKKFNIAKSSCAKISNVTTPSSFSNTYSLDFDGTNDFLVSSGNMDATEGNNRTRTWSWWLKAGSGDIGSGVKYILWPGDNNMAFLFNGSNLVINSSTAFPPMTASWTYRSDYFETGSWVHFCFTQSCPGGNNTEAVHKLYIDAVLKETWTLTRNQADYTMKHMSIGASFNSGSSPYGNIKCQMDEVAWWSGVALDADAVTAIYNSGVPIDLSVDSGNYDNSSDLRSWWRMGDGDTIDADDATIEDNAGSLDLVMTNMVQADVEEDVPS